MTFEMYNLLIQSTVSLNYRSVRVRIDFSLLLVTGVQINELLTLKVSQLQTLLDYHWISIDRFKRGPSNHKTFLIQEGKNVVKKERKTLNFFSI
jgi:integrase